MANYTYGAGTANQFTDASQRQVLELGDKIHFYNPDITPLLTIGGRMSTSVTPVPIFEWMEDEFFVKKTVTLDLASNAAIGDTATDDVNQTGSVITLERQSDVEAFEVGAIYDASKSGGDVSLEGMSAYMVIAIGQNVDVASPTDKMIQVVGFDNKSGSTYTYDQHAEATAILSGATGTLTLTYAGTPDTSGTETVLAYAATQTNLTNDSTFVVQGLGGYNEGAVIGDETRKKVRRLKNCTQIFREPYTITGTQNVSKMYGGDELARLQARKLAKIKTDMEWALLTNGDISLDAAVENPKRTFAGFGIGGSAGTGVIKSNDGRNNTGCQWDESAGLDNLDAMCEYIFRDLLAGSMEKTVFCSNKWLKNLAIRTRGTTGAAINAQMGTDVTSGLRVTKYLGPVGALNFVVHPMLNGTHEDYALAIDFSNFDWRPLNGRDMQLRSNVVKDGRDGQTDEWLFEGGPEIRNEQTHAILKMV